MNENSKFTFIILFMILFKFFRFILTGSKKIEFIFELFEFLSKNALRSYKLYDITQFKSNFILFFFFLLNPRVSTFTKFWTIAFFNGSYLKVLNKVSLLEFSG